MNDSELAAWFSNHRITEEVAKLIQRIRSSPPSRKVQGGRSNVTGRYPSRKMGHTVQFESHKVELAFIREYEFDDNVLEYYDQPGPIKISYRTVNGRQTTAFTTPDFFVIRNDGSAGWEECKPEQDLVKLAKKSERFIWEGGKWRCQSGEEYATQYGLYFQVRSSSEINWVWQRNIEYLSDYFQSTDHLTQISPDSESFIKALVSCKQGILLSELIANADRYTADDVFQLIVSNGLYINLNVHSLIEQNRTPVYTDQVHAEYCQPIVSQLEGSAIEVELGATVSWDGRLFQIVNFGDEKVWLQNDQGDLATLDHVKLGELVRIGAVRGAGGKIAEHTDDICNLLKMKGPATYAKATMRYNTIAIHLTGTAKEAATRTERDWIKRFREAEAVYGIGYLGLLDNTEKKGNRLPKLPAESYELMKKTVDEQYLNPTGTNPITVYGHYCNLCQQSNVIAASFKTFTTKLKQLDAKETEEKRKGSRAAYQLDVFYWELELTTSRHGDRPFEIVHIDHTELDIELVDSVTGMNFGRPWLTLMVDANSRRILAYVLSYEPPSYRSCMIVVRECVRIHNRLPQTIVVDGGADFNSTYFEQLIAFYGITKKNRPGAKPRYGSVMERLFGVTNQQFVHSLRGNTQITKNVRQVTKSVNPANQAVWTLPKLKDRIGQYFSEIYEDLAHPALGESPRKAFERGLANHGARFMKFIRYDDAFILSTLPSTVKGTAKVIRSRGIKINNFYYWNNELRAAYRLNVPVRYDPYDVAIIYAYIKGQWIRCISQHYALLKGRSEKEVAMITQEILKRRSNHNKKIVVNAQKVAGFIAETQGIELELKEMRKAAEMRPDSRNLATIAEDGVVFETPTSDIEFEVYDELTI